MAKVPLRVYNSDIEKLIEGGQIQEAIAHCRHILKIFPKHIDTYRLLGKAFLEGQRYTEAADILRRVLSVLPDDFISHLGMSIISEDEGNLDAAIFHMEKAFEIQPASPAIQGELRRLYGRRDGAEPPRIRMNRGALVRMYARGELYPQAIAETRAALHEDSQRTDLLVILARLYFLSGQKVQAVETASSLVSKLPYCYEANRILAEVLPTTARSQDAQIYQQRLEALDPYAGLMTAAMSNSADVPDVAVQIDRLEYVASAESSETPEWTRNIGVAWEESEPEATPDWMKPEEKETQPASTDFEIKPEEAAPAAEADIPEWMASAGWSPAGQAVETTGQVSAFNEEEEEVPFAAAGEIPDWLQTLAPAVDMTAETTNNSTEEDEQWAALLAGKTPQMNEATGETVESSNDSQAPAPDALPEWLNELAPAQDGQTAAQAPVSDETDDATMPDWLANLGAAQSPLTPSQQDNIASETMAGNTEGTEIPGWLATLEPSQQAQDDFGLPEMKAKEGSGTDGAEIPDWLSDLGTSPQTPAESLPFDAKAEEVTAEEEPSGLPEWLNDVAPVQSEQGEAVNTGSPDENDAIDVESVNIPDWLKDMAPATTDQPMQPESLDAVSTVEADLGPSVTLDHPNDIEQITSPERTDAPATTSETPVDSSVEEITPEDDMDAALAWLEALAARQGADEATLLTSTDERRDDMPDWLQQQADVQTPEKQPEPDKAEVEGITPLDNLPLAVDEVAETQPEVISAAGMESETVPSTEEKIAEPSDVEQAIEILDMQITTETTAEQDLSEPDLTASNLADSSDMDAAMAWLENLAQKQGADEETLLIKPDARTDAPPTWLTDLAESTEATPTESIDTLPSEVESPVEFSEPEVFEPEITEVSITPESTISELPAEENPEVIPAPLSSEAVESLQPAEEAPMEPETPETPAEKTQPVRLATAPLETAQPVAQPAETAEPTPAAMEDRQTEETLASKPGESAELPSWLSDLEPEPSASSEDNESPETPLPIWLRDLEAPAQHKTDQPAVVLTPPEWIREESPITPEPAEVESESPLREAEQERIEPIPSEPEAAIEAAPGVPEPSLASTPGGDGDLEIAQQALRKGNVEKAVEQYSRFIQSGSLLEETIHDLRDATYRYPMDTAIWQTLGDAYLRSNRLQDALDAYTKAEELLR